MREYAENGLTLRWAEACLPGLRPGLQRAIVELPPAHPANGLRALYALDGGAEREVRGIPLGQDPVSGAQRFALDLPLPPAGSLLTWRPVGACSGREADPRRGAPPAPVAPAFAQPPGAPTPIASPDARFRFDTEFLARVTAPLDRHPTVVGETPDGLRIIYSLGEGATLRGPRLNGSITHVGGDWMLVRRDGIGISDIRVLIRTTDGAVITGEYGGVVDFGPDGYARMAAGGGPAQATVQQVPRYVTAAAPYLWLNRLQCVAVGRVTLATLLVEYDLYGLRSRAAVAA